MAQTTTERVASNLRAELARRKISGRQLSTRLGWPASTTSRRLSGAAPLTLDDLAEIAAVLDLPVSALMGEQVA